MPTPLHRPIAPSRSAERPLVLGAKPRDSRASPDLLHAETHQRARGIPARHRPRSSPSSRGTHSRSAERPLVRRRSHEIRGLAPTSINRCLESSPGHLSQITHRRSIPPSPTTISPSPSHQGVQRGIAPMAGVQGGAPLPLYLIPPSRKGRGLGGWFHRPRIKRSPNANVPLSPSRSAKRPSVQRRSQEIRGRAPTCYTPRPPTSPGHPGSPSTTIISVLP